MKLTVCFLLICATFYAGATNRCTENTDLNLEAAVSDGILGQVLQMLLDRFDDMDRKLLELQIEMAEHREDVERNRATNENTFVDFLWAIHRLEQDVGRNMSVIQDRSLVILDQQKSCANHDRLREQLFDHIPKQNYSSCQTLEQTLLSFRSRIPNYVTASTTPPTPPTTTTTQPTGPIYASCKDAPANVSGVYLIRVNTTSTPFKVYCEMKKFGGGWIVVQHRFNGSVDFNRNWAEYRNGFGELNSEFWLGLEYIHQLTTTRAHELIVDINSFSGSLGHARYSSFKIGSESEKYKLKSLGTYSGNIGDSLKQQVGRMFSAKDQDNDEGSKNWAVYCLGGWWYGTGDTYSNLNGQYSASDQYQSSFWYMTKSDYVGMKYTMMMIREI